MIRRFRQHGDAVRARFVPFEVDLFRSLHEQLDLVLHAPDQADPVVRRLFPPPVLGDPEAEREVRAMLGPDLLAARREGLQAFAAILDRLVEHRGVLRVDLVDDEPYLVLGVVNDLRLAIGASLDIEALDRGSLTEDDPVVYRLAVMDHLAAIQEQLLELLDPPSVSYARDLDVDEL